MSWPRVVASASVGLALGLLLAGGWSLLGGGSSGDVGWLVLTAVVGACSVAVGVLVARQAPHNAVAALLPMGGVAMIASGASDAYGATAVRPDGGLPGAGTVALLGEGSWVWLYVPLALLVLVFPDGRFTRSRWRWVALGLLIVGVGYPVLQAIAVPPGWSAGLALSLFPLLVLSAVSLVSRYRHADARVRTQVGWLCLAGLGLPLTLLLCWLSYLLLAGPDLVPVGLALTGIAVPLATAVAMFRHDLYDLDRAVGRSITWAVVAVLLLIIFTGVTALGGLALGHGSPVVAAVATALCAALLAPLHRRLAATVARRRHPRRQSALDALAGLTVRVHSGRSRPEEMEGVLRAALGDDTLRVALLPPVHPALLTITGDRLELTADDRVVPVRLGPLQIGGLVSHRPAGLLAIADAAALLVELVRLRLDLAAALEEVSSSRARLLHAGYEERRRLERDLHDGAQQRLVALGMSLRLAQRRERRVPAPVGVTASGAATRTEPTHHATDLDDLIDEAVAELALAVGELRQIAHGLRPSSLDDGLGAALTTLTRRYAGAAAAATVRLDVDPSVPTSELPDDVAATAYFVAGEAVANALKHADAARIDITAAVTGEGLVVRVRDDGRGGATVRPGSGLAGLVDRVSALHGQLSLDSEPGRGTTVETRLPCAW